MGHVVDGHGTVALRVKHKGVHHSLDITQGVGILVVEHLRAIDDEVVHIQVRLQVTQGDAPRVVARVLHQRVNSRVDNQAHRVGIGRFDFKSHCSIFGNFGAIDGRCKVTLSAHGERHENKQKEKVSFHIT